MLNNPVGFYTLFKRENDRFMKVYLQTILSPVVSNILFMAIFGLSLQGRFVPHEGVSYLEFLVPGLIMMGMLSNAFQNSSSSLIIRKYNNTLTDLLVLPISATEMTLAFMLSSLSRGVIVGAVTFVTAMLFVPISITHIGVVIAATVLVNSIFGLLGTLIALWSPDFDKLALITNFVITPLTYLGGVFYSIGSLPEGLQTLSRWNPLLYMIDSLRYGFIGISDVPIMHSMIVMIVTAAALFLATQWVFRTGYRMKS